MQILDAVTFGRMIRARRKSLGLRQRELALTANVGERFIVELEAGKATCHLGKALTVARALRIDLNDGGGTSKSSDDGYDLPDIILP